MGILARSMAFEKSALAAGTLARGYQLPTGRNRFKAHEINNSIGYGIVTNTSSAMQSTNPVGCFFLAIRGVISFFRMLCRLLSLRG
jgi:hypothetical protein